MTARILEGTEIRGQVLAEPTTRPRFHYNRRDAVSRVIEGIPSSGSSNGKRGILRRAFFDLVWFFVFGRRFLTLGRGNFLLVVHREQQIVAEGVPAMNAPPLPIGIDLDIRG